MLAFSVPVKNHPYSPTLSRDLPSLLPYLKHENIHDKLKFVETDVNHGRNQFPSLFTLIAGSLDQDKIVELEGYSDTLKLSIIAVTAVVI